MNASLPLLLPILCLFCAGAQAAAPTGPASPTVAIAPAVPASPNASASTGNPLTGQPLVFEATQRRLEQMRLETQLLEEEARQAAIRSNMTLAPARRSNEERRPHADMFGPAAAGAPIPAARGAGPGAAARRAATPATARGRSPSVQPPEVAPAMPAATPTLSPHGPQILAILRNGEQRRAIVQAGGATATVSEGEDWMGRRIGPITDGSVTVDGVVIDLPRNPAVIAAVDRRSPPGQPQAVQANAPAAVPRGTTGAGPAPALPRLPPLPPLPVIGPLDPRNPLSAIGPQPTLAMPVPAISPRPATPAVPAVMPGAPVSDLLP